MLELLPEALTVDMVEQFIADKNQCFAAHRIHFGQLKKTWQEC